jgi:hypothetical protein
LGSDDDEYLDILNIMRREELHKLIDSMPEGAMEAVHRVLLAGQVWPPVASPRKTSATEVRTADGRIASFASQHWEDDTLVARRQHRYGQHQITVVERIRIDGERLIYKYEVQGPGEKRDEREVIFDLV